VAASGDIDFSGAGGGGGLVDYAILVSLQGDLAVGGVLASGNIFGAMTSDPTFRVRRGDLGALVAGLTPGSNAEDGFILFAESTNENTDIAIDVGNLRAIEAVSIGAGAGGEIDTDPEIEVPNGSVGLLRTTGTSTGLFGDHILAVDFGNAPVVIEEDDPVPFLSPIGGDFQLIETATNFAGNLEANGGIGVIRAAEITGTAADISFFLNRDGIGNDGIIDLIDVAEDFAGPAIDTGPGGNVRYIRVGGDVSQDAFFGGGGGVATLHDPGESVRISDDGGGRIVIQPIGVSLGDLADVGDVVIEEEVQQEQEQEQERQDQEQEQIQ